MIRLHSEDCRRMLAHALACLPEEACGLLAGTQEGDVREVKYVYLLTNADASHEHFAIDPREQLAAVRDMRAHGWQPLGNWHSHPASPSRPSAEDIRLARDGNASYIILSLQSKSFPNLNSFRIRDGSCEWEMLEICD